MLLSSLLLGSFQSSWPNVLVDFVLGAGCHKTLFGTGFPVCGHRHFLEQLDKHELDEARRQLLLEENARAVFGRLP